MVEMARVMNYDVCVGGSGVVVVVVMVEMVRMMNIL